VKAWAEIDELPIEKKPNEREQTHKPGTRLRGDSSTGDLRNRKKGSLTSAKKLQAISTEATSGIEKGINSTLGCRSLSNRGCYNDLRQMRHEKSKSIGSPAGETNRKTSIETRKACRHYRRDVAKDMGRPPSE